MSEHLQQLQRIRSAFSRAAPHYDANAMQQREVLGRLVQLASPHITNRKLVLDIGCGTGALARLVDWPLIGLDAAEAMCRYAQTHNNMPAVAADMNHLPFANDSIASIVSSLALQWSETPSRSLGEWNRVLEGGGVLAFSTYLTGTLNELSESFYAVGMPSPVQVFVSHEELLNSINKHNYHILHIESNTLSIEYNTLKLLIKYLKTIGASTPSSYSGTLRTPHQFRQLEAAYREQFGSITSRWEIGYYLLQKPL